ncbi:MAG TPA: DUF4232 domain-containing protein [Pseudonocardiaceae bacterium]
MTRHTVARGLLLTTGAVAAIALAGCGGGSTATGGTGTTPSTTTTTASGGNTFIPATTPPGGNTATGPGNGGGEGSGGNGGAPMAGGTPECRTANLKATIAGGNAAAGHSYRNLQFTNISNQNCVIVGFPGVSYVTGANGTQVGAPAEHDGNKGGQIVLKPGQVASSVVTFTDVAVFDATACKPTPTLGLRVYPPDQTASLFVAQNGTGCAGNPPSAQLRVATVQSGNGSA